MIALVAGEASGDSLGAALIEVLRARLPGVRIVATTLWPRSAKVSAASSPNPLLHPVMRTFAMPGL